MNFDLSAKGEKLREDAKTRWLLPEEILEILHCHSSMNFIICDMPPFNPKDGDIFLFDRLKTTNYKTDGINWIKKKANINAIREDFIRLTVNGQYAVTGLYTYAADNQDIKRRSYRLPEGSSMILVHYRNCAPSELQRKILSDGINNHRRVPSSQSSIIHETIEFTNNKNNINNNNHNPSNHQRGPINPIPLPMAASPTINCDMTSDVDAETLNSLIDWDESLLNYTDNNNNNVIINVDMTTSPSLHSVSWSFDVHSPSPSTSLCPPQHLGLDETEDFQSFEEDLSMLSNLSESSTKSHVIANSNNNSNDDKTIRSSYSHPLPVPPSHSLAPSLLSLCQPEVPSAASTPTDPSREREGLPLTQSPRLAQSSSNTDVAGVIVSDYDANLLWNRTALTATTHSITQQDSLSLRNNQGLSASHLCLAAASGSSDYRLMSTPRTHVTGSTNRNRNKNTANHPNNRMDKSSQGYPGDNTPQQVVKQEPSSESYEGISAIIDFSPEVDVIGGGTKVIICLSKSLDESDHKGLQVLFGWIGVDAIMLGPNTLRCYSPNLAPGKYPLAITNIRGDVLAMPTVTSFEYRCLKGTEFPSSSLGSDGQYPSGQLSSGSGLKLSLLHSATARVNKRRASLKLKQNEKNDSNVNMDTSEAGDGSNSNTDKEMRGNKIRIIERDSATPAAFNRDGDDSNRPVITGKNINSSTPPAPENTRPVSQSMEFPVGGGGDVEGWLEDADLSSLRPSDLSSIMDHLLLKVVKQLVQFASSDEELKAELDSLDDCGFSLLHYCSLFNLELLVPVILSKGGGVQRKTRCGTTALHLAAGAGHMEVTKLLVESGADCEELDAYGLRPIDRAIQTGFIHIANYLSTKSKPQFTSSRQLISQSMKPSDIDSIPPLYRTSPADSHKYSPVPNTPGSGSTSHSRMPSVDQSEARLDQKLSSPSSTGDLDLRPNSLLYDAFASLSLADKCAFSLSLGSHNPHDTDLIRNSMDASSEDNEFDVQSVLSETDKESLDMAMSMMTPSELSKVEAEVRVIQNNVRTWLLRKNYINLREAARTLQMHWRHRKHLHSAPTQDSSQSQSADNDKSNMSIDFKPLSSTTSPTTLSPIPDEIQQRDGKLTTAAATLQAATRGMLARKYFWSLKRQAMASLVIQKTLMTWWQQKGGDFHLNQLQHPILTDENSTVPQPPHIPLFSGEISHSLKSSVAFQDMDRQWLQQKQRLDTEGTPHTADGDSSQYSKPMDF